MLKLTSKAGLQLARWCENKDTIKVTIRGLDGAAGNMIKGFKNDVIVVDVILSFWKYFKSFLICVSEAAWNFHSSCYYVNCGALGGTKEGGGGEYGHGDFLRQDEGSNTRCFLHLRQQTSHALLLLLLYKIVRERESERYVRSKWSKWKVISNTLYTQKFSLSYTLALTHTSYYGALTQALSYAMELWKHPFDLCTFIRTHIQVSKPLSMNLSNTNYPTVIRTHPPPCHWRWWKPWAFDLSNICRTIKEKWRLDRGGTS